MIAVLFARADSCYKLFSIADVWDETRDARNWPGGARVVAHPPCRLWGRLRTFARSRDPEAEKQLARDAIAHIQREGGILEHPAGSTLWADQNLPLPDAPPDKFGGWTLEIRQCDWGHRAEKLTWLYIVGLDPADLPPVPPRREPTHVIQSRKRSGYLPHVSKAEREHTPIYLAAWLLLAVNKCCVI